MLMTAKSSENSTCTWSFCSLCVSAGELAAMPNITKDAILKYALSATTSKMEAARFLGVNKARFNKLLKQYKTESYFEEKYRNIIW